MRILKGILFLVIGLIVLWLIAGLFISKDFSCVRSVTIQKPKAEIFEFIKYLGNQEKFSKWAKMDPEMQHGLKGNPDGTVGAISWWNGNKDVGQGEQEIKSLKEGERIDFELRFEKPMKSTANAYLSTTDEGANTKVSWGIEGKSPYPWNVMNLFMDKMMGGDLETGLNNLKAVMENPSN